MRAAKKMARKLKVYGKKKGQDIVSAFEKLTLLSPSDHDTNHNKSRDALSPKSHNIRQQRRQHEKETREDLKLQENQQIQAQDALVPFADSPIRSNYKEARDSGNAPPRTLRSSRRGKNAADPAPVRKLTLDQKIVDHLKPLTELESVSGPRDIQLWHAEWTSLCAISKIAEGSYGSVFKMSDKKRSQSATIGKLVPLKAISGVGSRKASNTTIEAAVSEVKLLELMSDVPGFVMFRGAEVLIGALPKALRDEYRAFTAKEHRSDSGSSEAETWFPNHQAWLFIEMDNAGVELDNALTEGTDGSGLQQVSVMGQRFLPVKRTRDIFWGVVEALMRGEQIHGFEHRDLHLSNICIELNRGEELDSGYELIPNATNVSVTIIDYTFSRATMPDNSPIFNPMSDESIFEGNSTVDLQFDIYRHMRDLVADEETGKKDWDAYVPVTNVLWLSLLLTKLMQWTPRPKEISKEQELWQSLNALMQVLDLGYLWSWDLLSACDVARYMQVGKKEFWEEIKEQEERKDEGEGEAMELLRESRRLRMVIDDETFE